MDDRPAFDPAEIAELLELHRLAEWPGEAMRYALRDSFADTMHLATEPFRQTAGELLAAAAADLAANLDAALHRAAAPSLADGFSYRPPGRPAALGGIAYRATGSRPDPRDN